MISVSGANIAVTEASGSLIDCGGARWWDGIGSNAGGKVKPKFYADSLTVRMKSPSVRKSLLISNREPQASLDLTLRTRLYRPFLSTARPD
jgi:hypothetical protein